MGIILFWCDNNNLGICQGGKLSDLECAEDVALPCEDSSKSRIPYDCLDESVFKFWDARRAFKVKNAVAPLDWLKTKPCS